MGITQLIAGLDVKRFQEHWFTDFDLYHISSPVLMVKFVTLLMATDYMSSQSISMWTGIFNPSMKYNVILELSKKTLLHNNSGITVNEL